ncbi:MAG: NADH-quinone oxidoreductase subunit N [Methylacidiphilales bacterium]|nr:NADH-quinone oxidoreductase subunit N [Candidatus Methylacidiphilales bacterium]
MLSSAYVPYLAPEMLLTVWAMLLLLADAFLSLTPRAMAALSLAGILSATLLTLGFNTTPLLYWGGLCSWDGAAKFYHVFFLAVAALVTWMADDVQKPVRSGASEFIILPLFTTAGLMLLSSANDFMLLFVALELVTISFYILVAYQRRSVIALEAGVKYLILGALSSAFLVMGVAYIFGLTGTTLFTSTTPGVDSIANHFHNDFPVGVAFGLLLVLTGIGFKIAMVPFHSWAPDVYEGAPNSITAFLSVGSKAGGLIMLIRVVLGVFDHSTAAAIWIPALSIGAILSLILGNLAAIPQRNLKRLLGYSSIGHSGFILVAIIAASATLTGTAYTQSPNDLTGQVAVAAYLVTYLLATFTAFIVLAVLERRLPGLEIHHLAGLSQRSPLLAAAFALSLISMAGVPPMSGFIAKFYVVLVAWNKGLYTLLGFTIFAAVAALYYYLGPIKTMYWSEPLDEAPIRVERTTRHVLVILMILLVLTGFWAQSISILVHNAVIGKGVPAASAVAVNKEPRRKQRGIADSE